MTRKRFTKLFYALMQEINKKHIEVCGTPAEKWGRVLENALTIKPYKVEGFTSYEELWERLLPIRKAYGMDKI